MAVADCYVSLHRSEGFGLGIAEAMALGKPVIATRVLGTCGFSDAGEQLPRRLSPRADPAGLRSVSGRFHLGRSRSRAGRPADASCRRQSPTNPTARGRRAAADIGECAIACTAPERTFGSVSNRSGRAVADDIARAALARLENENRAVRQQLDLVLSSKGRRAPPAWWAIRCGASAGRLPDCSISNRLRPHESSGGSFARIEFP